MPGRAHVPGHSAANESGSNDHDGRPDENGCYVNPDFFDLLAGCHQRLVGTPLAGPEATARWLYEDAPFGVLAHDAAHDPRFTYANRTAQRCFEYDWAEFVGLPSRLSAEPDRREDRQRLLDAVHRTGFATGYRGQRIAKSGRRFWIEDVTMWNLVDGGGVLVGQAATFQRWRDA
ncbi:MEKHLA domain-containing protein [Nonomuraea sp. NPDC049028]|uniref:MEKHLA domain-containing protein n=1 Tax=Nonomuraea sp. NPDC049028 TaxID=3364348 RepID=UPI0037198156